jgi:hypothetical protein
MVWSYSISAYSILQGVEVVHATLKLPASSFTINLLMVELVVLATSNSESISLLGIKRTPKVGCAVQTGLSQLGNNPKLTYKYCNPSTVLTIRLIWTFCWFGVPEKANFKLSIIIVANDQNIFILNFHL